MKLVTNLSLGEQLHLSLSKYGTIKVYFSNNDEYKRNYLMNKTLTVYNVLINTRIDLRRYNELVKHLRTFLTEDLYDILDELQKEVEKEENKEAEA